METEETKKEITNLQINFMCIQKDISFIKDTLIKSENKIDNFIKTSDEKYVSKDMFRPVQKIVYGLIGGVLITVLGAIMVLIIK